MEPQDLLRKNVISMKRQMLENVFTKHIHLFATIIELKGNNAKFLYIISF